MLQLYSLIPEHDNPFANSILIAWPYPSSDWQYQLEYAEQCYSEMLSAFSNHCTVVVLLHSTIDEAEWITRYKPKSTVKIIDSIDYNDTWTRDYGPLCVYESDQKMLPKTSWISFGFNGWGNKYPSILDNQATSKLAQRLRKPYIDHHYILEGGAVEVNNARVLLANKTCLVNDNRNPNLSLNEHESIISKALDISDFAWLDIPPLTGDDTDGHIDTIARFASDNHIVYTQPNPDHPDNNTLIELESQLTMLAKKYDWTLTGLPTPKIYSSVDNHSLLPATYANFLIIKKTVFIPFYTIEYDETAFHILKNVFSGYSVVPISCRALLEQCGSLHCATMQFTL